ncbi:MAG TPA: hypothetical protein VLB73_05295 [Patescibacteria group bacterium]|nr:hypothetical protein [Patescibacteria group bacterium]
MIELKWMKKVPFVQIFGCVLAIILWIWFYQNVPIYKERVDWTLWMITHLGGLLR